MIKEILNWLQIDTSPVTKAVMDITESLQLLSASLLSLANCLESNSDPARAKQQAVEQSHLPVLSQLDAMEGNIPSNLGREIALIRTKLRELMYQVGSDLENSTTAGYIFRGRSKQLDQLIQCLTDWHRKVIQRQISNRYWSRFLVIASLVCSTALVFYLRITTGFGDKTIEVVDVPDKYEVGSNGLLVINESFKKEFIEGFSPAFFGNNSNEKMRGFKNILIKVTLRNASTERSALVKTVQVTLDKFEPKAFPWGSVDVHSSMQIKISSEKVIFEVTSIAPALDVEAEITAGSIHSNKTSPLLQRGRAIVFSDWTVLKFENDVLDDLVLSLITETQDLSEETILAASNGKKYEKIRSVQRLLQLSKESATKTIEARLIYKSIKGDRKEEIQTQDVPKDTILIRENKNLFVYHEATTAYDLDKAVSASSMIQDLAAPEAAIKDGVPLLISEHYLNGRSVPETDLHVFDELLKPRGYLLLNISVNNLLTGTYYGSVYVNGKKEETFSFEGFYPEKDRFEIGDLGWLQEQIKSAK